MQKKRRLTVQEAAVELGVSVPHIYTLLKAGLIKAYDISQSGNSKSGKCGPHSMRICAASICEFLESRKIDPEKYYQ